jgi:predicted AAA+ superfamily ATPase
LYIQRDIDKILLDLFSNAQISQRGVILCGVVGSGKTTAINHLCSELERRDFQIVKFDGDDVRFRTSTAQNSRFILDRIREKGLRKPFIFVDEIQKTPETFDAIKLAFDELKVPFIVSGSNPAYLRTEANDRLQRRATIKTMFPLTISEILHHEKILPQLSEDWFVKLLWKAEGIESIQIPPQGLNEAISLHVNRYLTVGGIPQAHLAGTVEESFEFIKLVAERGVTQTYDTTVAIDDDVRQDLARQNSREFSYQGCHQRLRTSKRHVVDKVITHLMNHGYLFKKKPYLGEFEGQKSTYLATYSWIDSGIVGYYTGNINPDSQELGFRLEAYIHCQIIRSLEKIPLKSQIFYYKPFTIKPSNNALHFKQGEIDFVVRIGSRVIPIEVKLATQTVDIDTKTIENYINTYAPPFGLVIYGGAPFIDKTRKLVFLPYWMI